MALEFRIPQYLRDVEAEPEQEGLLYARQAVNVASMDGREVNEFIQELAFELSEKEVLCIEEEEVFSRAYSLVRDFESLSPTAKVHVVDIFRTSFSCLAPSIESVISAYLKEGFDGDGSISAHMRSHRNALKIYTFFLHWLIVAAESESVPETGESNKVARKTRKKHLPPEWRWSEKRPQVVRPLAVVLLRDLEQLFQGNRPEESLIGLFTTISFTLLENPDIAKETDTKEAVFRMLNCCAEKYGCLEPVAASIIDQLYKHERLTILLADLVSSGEGILASEIIQQIAKTHPKSFVRDLAGTRNIADFLQSLAEKHPKIVAKNLSLLMPYLNEEPYIIRNGIIAIMGLMVVKVFLDKQAEGSNGTETARIRSKDSLLNHLLERARDSSAYTRSKVLQTWAYLCEEKAIPLSYWNEVTEIAVGRLEDKAALVRKSALQLLYVMMQMNPFGDDFTSSRIEASLEAFEKQLQEMNANESTETETATGTETGTETDGTETTREPQADEPSTSKSSKAASRTEIRTENVTENEINSEKQASPSVSQSPSDETLQETQYNDSGPSQVEEDAPKTKQAGESSFTLGQIRTLIASLKTFLSFSRQVEGAIPTAVQLLASNNRTDVEQALQLLTLAFQFHVDGAEKVHRKMLPLVFSQDPNVRKAVEGAIMSLYLQDSFTSAEIAHNLAELTLGASIGDLTSLEEIICGFVQRGEITPDIVAALWECFKFNQPRITPALSRGALVILTMAAKSNPEIMTLNLSSLLRIGFGARAREDALLARYTCIALQRLPAKERQNMHGSHKVFSSLSSILIESPLPENNWYTAAEQAIKAIYSLHGAPEAYSSQIIRRLVKQLFPHSKAVDNAGGDDFKEGLKEVKGEEGGRENSSNKEALIRSTFSSVSVSQLSRFLFIVGQVALQHLVYVENAVKLVRQQQAEREKAEREKAATERLERTEGVGESADTKEDGINVELGVGASLDAELDNMFDETEREICSKSATGKTFLIGAIAPLVARICQHTSLLQQHSVLRSSAVLALSKLMAIDASFCEARLPLLVTASQQAPPPSVRANALAALGDAAARHPALLAPWSVHLYGRLRDTAPRVRKNAVLVLSHLALNDMIKVKGHLSEMALRVEDEDRRISDLARLFFLELAQKGGNPIYSLFPEMLNRLSLEESLSRESIRSILQFLISLIQKEKQNEGLIERLSSRFEGISDVRQSRDIAFSLSLLSYSERGIKRLTDNFRYYKSALHDAEVMSHFSAILAKAKKFNKPDVKSAIEEFEEKISEAHAEQEEEEKLQKRRLQKVETLKVVKISTGISVKSEIDEFPDEPEMAVSEREQLGEPEDKSDESMEDRKPIPLKKTETRQHRTAKKRVINESQTPLKTRNNNVKPSFARIKREEGEREGEGEEEWEGEGHREAQGGSGREVEVKGEEDGDRYGESVEEGEGEVESEVEMERGRRLLRGRERARGNGRGGRRGRGKEGIFREAGEEAGDVETGVGKRDCLIKREVDGEGMEEGERKNEVGMEKSRGRGKGNSRGRSGRDQGRERRSRGERNGEGEGGEGGEGEETPLFTRRRDLLNLR